MNGLLEDCLKEIETAIVQLLYNYPSPWLGRLLKWLLIPLGQMRHGPSDKLDHQVATILQSPVASRNRLGQYQYWQPSEHNPAGRIRHALDSILNAEPILKRSVSTKVNIIPLLL
ncbi:DUF1974 domain-containing protein [Vibrio sp. PP-XX7]